MAEMHRQGGEIGVVAAQHDLLRRRLGARHLDDVGSVAQPPQQLGDQLPRRHAEGARNPRPAAGDVADQLLPLEPDRAQQHGARIALEDLRDLGQVGGAVHGLQLVAERLDEAPQSERLEICGRDRFLLLDDAHVGVPALGPRAGRRLPAPGPWPISPWWTIAETAMSRMAARSAQTDAWVG